MSAGMADSNSNASQNRTSVSQSDVSGGSHMERGPHGCGSNDGSIPKASIVTREGSQSQDAETLSTDLVYHTSDEASEQSAANTSVTSSNGTMEPGDRTVLSMCEDTMMEASLAQESETETSNDKASKPIDHGQRTLYVSQ